MKYSGIALATLLATGIAPNVSAAPLTFFGQDLSVFDQSGTPIGGFPNSTTARSNFLSNLQGVGTESFDGFASGTSAPLALTFPGAGTATLQGSGAVDDVPGTGQNATSGTNWWRTGASNNFRIDFSAPVAAFGFYGIDIGDINAQLTLTLDNGSPVVINIPHSLGLAMNGSVIFFGYIDEDNPFTSATFSNVGGGADDFGFDDMTIGSVDQVVTPVPVPGVLALLGIGLAGLALNRRRVAS